MATGRPAGGTRPDDVVTGGDEPGLLARLPRWLRWAALAAAVVVAGLALTRGGLLSSGEPPRPAPSPDRTSTAQAGPRLVARLGDRLLVVRDGEPRTATRLPRDLAADARLVTARLADSPSGPLVGVAGGTLFRADPDRQRYRALGAAEAVVGPSQLADRVYAVRGGAVAEVEVDTGSTTVPDAFPAFDATRAVEGLLVSDDAVAVLQSRPVGGGAADLTLVWSSGDASTGGRPPVQGLGAHGPVLGIAADWVITLDGCPGAGCRVVVVSVTRDTARARPVEPPPGWTFIRGPSAGRTHEALVPVRESATGAVALARLVPGGDRALLVRDTERVQLDADLADGPKGSVVLLTRPAEGGNPQVRVWDPVQPNVAPLARPPAGLPGAATLVCVCG